MATVKKLPEDLPFDDRPRSEVIANRPSSVAVWTVTSIAIFSFVVGGMGLVYRSQGYFWVFFLGLIIFFLSMIAGWAIGIMEYTEEQDEVGLGHSERKLDPQSTRGY